LETQPVVDPQTSQGRSIDVLIVEDWAPDAELLVHELRRGGFAPVWHRVDSEAEYVGRLDPPPDVVLADYSLPQFGAVRALELLRERQIDVPLIIVSGVIGEEVAVSMMAMGASDYLLKDRLARLSDAVRLAMAQKRLRDEKRRAERALRRSEERHRLLLHNIDEIVYVTEPGQPGRMTFVNERVQHILGYDPEELIVDPARWLDIVHPEDRPSLDRADVPAGAPVTRSYRARHKQTGDYRWLEERALPWADEAGRVIGILGVARDVTDRKRLEDRRERRLEDRRRLVEQELSTVLGSIGEGVVITDAAGCILSINPAMERLAGWDAGAVHGSPYTAVYRLLGAGGAEVPHAEHPVSKALAFGTVTASRGYDWFFETRDGRWVPVGLTAAPVLTDDGRLLGAVQIARDISHEHEVDRLKSSLVSVISNELRGPLAVIRGYVRSLLETASADDRTYPLQRIQLSAERITRIVEDLMAVSKIDSGQMMVRPVALKLDDSIRDAIAPFLADREFQLSLEGGVPPVCADRGMLKTILSNLVSNAVKYSLHTSPVSISARRRNGSVTVEVEDRGIGMSNAEMNSLFQKFFRVDRPEVWEAGGTGLGLYITKRLVEMQGGELHVESVRGRGSVFAFSLPVASTSLLVAERSGS
jgi:PAS domain S-box-containing protein